MASARSGTWGAAMAIEVRCGCAQLVYAEERFAGQHVQCPHCKAAVAVPVAVAAATAPAPAAPPRTTGGGQETPAEAAMTAGGGAAGLIAVWACSDFLHPTLVKILAFGAVMAILGGVLVLCGGRRSDMFR